MTCRAVTPLDPRCDRILLDLQHRQHLTTSRLFAVLLFIQWASAICSAVIISPKTWIGTVYQLHQHVWLATLLGFALAAFPAVLALLQPTRTLSRHVVAVAQMLFSCLLIHLMGGRIETHFHVFGSLAFLAFYYDWRVLVTASTVVVIDHALRATYLPLSVFGVVAASPWRWVEHAAWVVFEDIFLIYSCVAGRRLWLGIARHQADLESANAAIEARVTERTTELVASNLSLEENREALHTANAELTGALAEQSKLRDRLVAASRFAGRADVASCVLHNVGNVLNSVNVSASTVSERLRRSETDVLIRLGETLASDSTLRAEIDAVPKGRQLCDYLVQAGRQLKSDHDALAKELERLSSGLEHISQIILTQQSHARAHQVCESVNPADLFESALQLRGASSRVPGLCINRDFPDLGHFQLDRHLVIQILTNFISNALDALAETPEHDRRLTLRTRPGPASLGRSVSFQVIDNGVGIAPDNLARVVELGFTTKPTGNGFGLHSAATSAQHMGGSITVHSDGLGRGASFTLSLPDGASFPAASSTPASPADRRAELSIAS